MVAEFWTQMGFMRYPLAFSLLAVIGLALLSTGRLFRPGALPDRHTKTWIDAILFWGGFAVVCGVLGSLVGMSIAAKYIEAAGAVSPPLLWGGIKVALSTSVFGMMILALAALLWFALQLKWRLLDPARSEGAV
jgi:hypothetical protein